MMMISVGGSSPWRIDATSSASSFGRLREQMMSEVGGRPGDVQESFFGCGVTLRMLAILSISAPNAMEFTNCEQRYLGPIRPGRATSFRRGHAQAVEKTTHCSLQDEPLLMGFEPLPASDGKRKIPAVLAHPVRQDTQGIPITAPKPYATKGTDPVAVAPVPCH